jgi:DNA-directed RNA polymerase subunit RPC12/RpoP
MRAASLEPLEPYPGADALWRCRCEKCGREVRQSASNVKAGGSCVYCAGRRLDPDAVAATMAAADLEPLEDYRNADARWRCRCLVCGREVTPTWTQVKAGGRCAYCRGNRVDRTDAVRFMADAGLHPMEPFPGAHARWLCRCGTCGREVRQTYSKARTGRGCRYCASRGLDYSAAGVVYLVDHAGFFALKVGVSTTAATEERVATHARDGWALVGYWTVPSAEAAVVVERAVLRWWRETLHAPQALTAADMPRGGFTETASRLFVDSDRTVAFVRSLVESERATLPGSPH